jgi:hypothetical protein
MLAHEVAAPALDAAMKAQRGLHEALRDMTNAEQQTRTKFGGQLVVDGRTVMREIPEERRAQLAADLGARFESTARAFDRNLGIVNEAIANLDNRLERALGPKKDSPATAQAASDIRNYVRGLSDGKRMDFLHKAATEGDHEVVTAVLSTTPWVSGINREQAATIRDLAAEHFAPKEYAARNAARKVADHLRQSSQNFVAAFKKLQPTVKPSAHAAAMAKLKESA